MMTNHIVDVSVKADYLKEQSDPASEHYVYAYRVSIHNRGDSVVQLLERHWKIFDANQQVQEVMGIGVVGEQPILQPGEIYTYTSGVVMKTTTGCMEGTYQMRDDDGHTFTAQIPTFGLCQAQALH